jgi:hypothetical protein
MQFGGNSAKVPLAHFVQVLAKEQFRKRRPYVQIVLQLIIVKTSIGRQGDVGSTSLALKRRGILGVFSVEFLHIIVGRYFVCPSYFKWRRKQPGREHDESRMSYFKVDGIKHSVEPACVLC